jgi:hypothetical protein
MYSTTVYLYQQIIRVLLIDTGGSFFTARYEPVYAKQLTVNKGVDNVLLFEFINQEQKPVNITGSTFVFRLLNQAGDELFIEKNMEILSAPLGRIKVVLNSADTIDIVAQPGSYSIQRTQGSYVQAVFVDDNAGARGNCNIVDSILPEFVPSGECTVPDLYGKNKYVGAAPGSNPDWARNQNIYNGGQGTEFYSSYIPTRDASLTTIKLELIHFTGVIKIQGADNYESVWYNVTDAREYYDETGAVYFNAVGYHPLLRVALNNSIGYGATATATVVDGVVTGLSLTNAGFDYVAAPYVQILGYGAGATAVATVPPGGGGVATLTVTNGGSGYVPLQFQSNQMACVVITNGVVQSIQYR